MLTSEEFRSRLDAVRAAYAEVSTNGDNFYHNGRQLPDPDDVSQWPNYDRYFKFYN